MNVNLRRVPRTPIDGVYTLCWQDAGLAHSVEVHGNDSSSSGICVRSGRAIPPGTSVYVEGPEGSYQGYALLRHCTSVNSHFNLGLEFSDAASATSASASKDLDYYEFLQISPRAGQETIHRVYRFMAARFHPDNPETGDLEKFLLLSRAYEALSDPERRAAYDAEREQQQVAPDPIFGLGTFVNGIEGEVNRRLAILAILYNKRRGNASEPGMSLWDLERKMAMPREYLDFAVWYLKSKGYITMADNSELTLTVSGVDYVEANADKDVTLDKLLHASSKTLTDIADRQERPAGVFQLTRGQSGNDHNGADA